mgnify:CR=1 FL=1
MPKKILIVEDEANIRELLRLYLEREGYTVLEAENGVEGIKKWKSDKPDMLLLDVMMPVMDGWEVCKEIRAESDVPIIMLTAREEEADKVMGLELGADDYITKPFSMRELMARVKANMRRTVPAELHEKPQPEADDGLRISRSSGMVYKNGRALELSAREFDILCFLSASPGRVFSREELMEQVWGYDYYGDLRAVDVAIRRLREKVEDEPASPKHIITKRGMGYYFAES